MPVQPRKAMCSSAWAEPGKPGGVSSPPTLKFNSTVTTGARVLCTMTTCRPLESVARVTLLGSAACSGDTVSRSDKGSRAFNFKSISPGRILACNSVLHGVATRGYQRGCSFRILGLGGPGKGHRGSFIPPFAKSAKDRAPGDPRGEESTHPNRDPSGKPRLSPCHPDRSEAKWRDLELSPRNYRSFRRFVLFLGRLCAFPADPLRGKNCRSLHFASLRSG